MEMTRERISFTFDPRDMLLSLQMGFSFVRAAVACAILERTSGLEPSSETTAPRYLKLVTVPSFLSYDKATSAVQMNDSIGEWFRTTVGVKQGCLLSPTLFNIFLERIMSDALEEHDGKVSIGGRNITNLRFADDIDALAEEEQELEALVESLDKTCTRYKMEISAEKTKLMTNSANGIQREIKANFGLHNLNAVTLLLKYLQLFLKSD